MFIWMPFAHQLSKFLRPCIQKDTDKEFLVFPSKIGQSQFDSSPVTQWFNFWTCLFHKFLLTVTVLIVRCILSCFAFARMNYYLTIGCATVMPWYVMITPWLCRGHVTTIFLSSKTQGAQKRSRSLARSRLGSTFRISWSFSSTLKAPGAASPPQPSIVISR